MNTITLWITTLTTVGLLSGSAIGQTYYETATVAITAQANNPATTDNGGVTTYANPTKYSFVTKSILADLAYDEHAAGLYSGSTFPTGAQLVLDANSNEFNVVDKNNNLLVNVSNILTIVASGTYGSALNYGKKVDANLNFDPFTNVEITTLTYDDSAISGSLGIQFALAGPNTYTSKETGTSGSGHFKDSLSGKLTGGSGDGVVFGNGMIVTGTLSLSGTFTN